MFGINKKDFCLIISRGRLSEPEFFNLRSTYKGAKSMANDAISKGASYVKITVFNGSKFIDHETVYSDIVEAPQ